MLFASFTFRRSFLVMNCFMPSIRALRLSATSHRCCSRPHTGRIHVLCVRVPCRVRQELCPPRVGREPPPFFCIAPIVPSLTRLVLSGGQCRPPGIRHISFIWRDMDLLLLLRLGFGLCFVGQTYPHKSLVSISCSCPPNFVLDFLHPHPHGCKLVLNYLIPPNWLIGDFHSR